MWIYLTCLTDSIFLAASEESASRLETWLTPLHIAKSTHTVKGSSCQEWQVETSTTLPYGTMLRLLGEMSLKAISTSYLADFPVKILALQAMEKAWQESEVDYFSRSCAWPKKSSPRLYSLKTPMSYQLEEEWKSSKRLPISGLTVGGLLRKLERKALRILEKDGFVWPTPTASQASKPIREPSPSRKKGKHGYDLQDKIGEIYPKLIGKRINPQFLEWMMSYPLGWTELKPWAIPFVLSKREKRLKS